MDINYFSILCFVWAAVGIVTRILMTFLGESWNRWEMDKAYSEEKPKWVYAVGLFSLLIVGLTWYEVAVAQIRYSWIIAVIISLTLIKVYSVIFNYQKFREFAKGILNNRKKLIQLNIGVAILSMAFIIMGIFLY